MQHNLPDRVLADIRQFAAADGVDKVILFGSRARGTHSDRSDVDIAVFGGDFDGFYDDIQEKTQSLLTFDVINMACNVTKELRQEIERDGVVLYEQKA